MGACSLLAFWDITLPLNSDSLCLTPFSPDSIKNPVALSKSPFIMDLKSISISGVCILRNCVCVYIYNERLWSLWWIWITLVAIPAEHNGLTHCLALHYGIIFLHQASTSYIEYIMGHMILLAASFWYSVVFLFVPHWTYSTICATVVLHLHLTLAMRMCTKLSFEWLWTILATTAILLMRFDPHIFSTLCIIKRIGNIKLDNFHSNAEKFWLWPILVTTNNGGQLPNKVKAVRPWSGGVWSCCRKPVKCPCVSYTLQILLLTLELQ